MGNAAAMVIGPAVGGGVVAAIGPGWGIALDGASYVISAACLASILPRQRTALPASETRSMREDLAEGVRAIRQARWLSLLLIQCAAINMVAFAPFNVIVPAILSRTPGGAGEWGTLLAAVGVGAVLGALVCTRRQPRRLLLGVELAAIMLVLPMFLLALRAPLPLVVLGSVAFGFGAATLSVLTITAIQREVAPSLLSRTMAMVQLVNIGFNPVGYLLAGPAMSLLGAPLSLEVGGLCVLLSVAVLLSHQEIRRFECRAA